MTPDERERMAILCERIAKEKDPDKYDDLVWELTSLLDLKRERLRAMHY
jgi:phage terminase large subunit-like protein